MVILSSIICKQLIDRDFLKDVDAQNLQYPAQTFVESMNLIETGDHQVNADRDPDLCAHGVLGGAEESFNAEVLFDPFKEEFDLPPAFVNGCDSQGGQLEVISEKDKPLAARSIHVTDTPERFGVIAFPLPCTQLDRLVTSQAFCFIDRARLADTELRVAFCADNKAGLRHLDTVKACEVEVAPVENVNASRLEHDLIEEMNVMNRSICNADEYWDWSGQVDLRVQFDGGLGSPEVCPRKHREAQVDGRGIDGIDHLFEIELVGIFGIQPTCLANENLSECFINMPVAELVSICQIGSCDVSSDAHGIKMSAVAKTGFDIPQTLTECDLRESHRKELVASRHAFAGSRHRMQINAAIELLSMNQIGNLGENQTSGVHPLLRMNQIESGQRVQMRHNPFSSLAA